MSAISPNTGNYFLGRGILYLDKFTDAGATAGEMDLGNCKEFKITFDKSILEHFSSRAGMRTKDKEVVTELKGNISFILDEYSKRNLVLAFLADEGATSQIAGSSTDEAVTGYVGKYTKLAYRQVTGTPVVEPATGGSAFTAGTDYTIDTTTGRLFVPNTGSLITEGLALHVTYTYETITSTTTIQIMKNNQIQGMLRFVGDPAAGPFMEVELWKVNLMPTGDFNFLTESDWGELSFEGSIESDSTNHVSTPYGQITYWDTDPSA